MTRLTHDINSQDQPWVGALREDTDLKRIDCSVNPVLATPAFVGGFLAVTAAGAAGYAVEETLGD